ncbi:DUF2200 family protein [Chryseobacterium populi]|uniref:Uncharacterized protein n=1 Tax=Chryseobacterium populi TaxID=1144316 RepID=J2JX84_9FLAO|nr:DUF2200 family protein [Chryseobacterium populi]EJL72485.1 hypothetical protein PMI13_01978 [Chryseobacterium populi]
MQNNTRVYKMAFAGVYPHYIQKAEKKGRTDELMRNIRYLDKLIDELAKGKPMDKILRK